MFLLIAWSGYLSFVIKMRIFFFFYVFFFLQNVPSVVTPHPHGVIGSPYQQVAVI